MLSTLRRSGPTSDFRLVLARERGVTLDGAALTDAALAAKLAPIVADRQATLTLMTDPEMRYERFDQVLAVVKRAGGDAVGVRGEGGCSFLRAAKAML